MTKENSIFAQLKAANEARTAGAWKWNQSSYGEVLKADQKALLGIDCETGLYLKLSKENEEFITLAANHMDKLLKVVEAAKEALPQFGLLENFQDETKIEALGVTLMTLEVE